MKITVVIPTLLKADKEAFQYSLDQYDSSDLVKRIVIIDNTESKDFKKQYRITGKFAVLKNPGNSGACCNAGMKLVDTEYYLQVNDDVICHKNVLRDCLCVMDLYFKIGLLQVETIDNQPLLEYVSTIHDRYQPSIHDRYPPSFLYEISSERMGWFQFGRTCTWRDIPAELKNFGGDDLVLLRIKSLGLEVAKIISYHISHMKATTVNSLGGLQEEHRAEEEIYKSIEKSFNENPR